MFELFLFSCGPDIMGKPKMVEAVLLGLKTMYACPDYKFVSKFNKKTGNTDFMLQTNFDASHLLNNFVVEGFK